MEPHMSMQYKKDLPASQQWLDANQPYFSHMSNILHLLDPQIYVRYTSINRFLPEGLRPTCGVWYACAIMRDMMGKGTPHKDPSDYHCGFNVSTAWGGTILRPRWCFGSWRLLWRYRRGRLSFFCLGL